MQPLILTLKLDAAAFQYFEALRQQHFPPERNFLAAHLTMFHHLLGEELAKIKSDLPEICSTIENFSLVFPSWRFLGKGAAINVEADELLKLRARLANIWRDWLTPQDRQKFQPHITVQNKVAPDEARRLFEKLAAEHSFFNGESEGVTLWHYLGAEWKFEEEFLFTAKSDDANRTKDDKHEYEE